MNPFDLRGKVALVTGANTGIGQGIALALAQAGADIAALARSEPTETLVQVRAVGRRAVWIDAEFGRAAPAADIVARVVDALAGLDILINNAGTIRRNDALEFTESDWDDVIDVNLKAAFFLAQQAARHWVAQKSGGKIINIASMLSFQGGIRVASYTASKSGLLGITRGLANEWARHGINVNAIEPGYFATNNTDALRKDENRNRDILARIPAGRWGSPGDLGGAAVFLASSAADYVHGAVLPVDGGWLAR
ncbi:MAG TPA: 2-dehydro-3-deoxy-D-gluconate 5-dehydrogenase KduD [Xanthomonadales bacterium]|nr:2-dehydro-3-deoxy-D-gluconate 5-dehydrogenase KduD [Xanthomonadales bacterium]